MAHDADSFPESTLSEKTPAQTKAAHDAAIAADRVKFESSEEQAESDYRRLTLTPPVSTSVSPTTSVSGAGNVTLTFTGSNLKATTKVVWNGAELVTTYISATQVSASCPKRSTAGTTPYYLSTDGLVSATANYTFT